jgi:hypothetical protein
MALVSELSPMMPMPAGGLHKIWRVSLQTINSTLSIMVRIQYEKYYCVVDVI